MPDKGFDSSVPETPRDGQYLSAVGFSENENQGVVIALRPCPECRAAVEESQMDDHESWHAGQEGSEPKSSKSSKSSKSDDDKDK
jgi:hypothetical protein